jgi:hypothetical protein
MKVKIHVELITDWGESRTVEACEFARPMTEFSAETVGLSLDDGKKLLQTVQQHVVESQTWELTEPSASARPARPAAVSERKSETALLRPFHRWRYMARGL